MLIAAGGPVAASDPPCKRGTLDALYCDEDGDLVADLPRDKARWRNPSTLVFAYTPIEDPALYERTFGDFTAHLARVTGKRVVYHQVQSNAAQIEAMRSGRLHVAGFATGPTGFAVNLAGAVPFAINGSERGLMGYHLILVVRADSPFQAPADLKGRKVAHTSPSSNSGNLAPRVLFPAAGLTPDVDYKVLYSGKHDQSILGVLSGDYDGAAVGNTVLERMARRGQLKAEAFRTLYKSPLFPTSSYAHAHDLDPALAAKIRQAFLEYRFSPELSKAFEGADRFLPIDYRTHWAAVRQIAEAAEGGYTRAALDQMSQREAAEAAKAKAKAKAAPEARPAAPTEGGARK
jgi:phosphonate transport system substrate-binding protein